jgi:hypothetical protein
MTEPKIRVFLDGNILAKPVTRSLLLFAADASGYLTTWSEYAETEGNRHLRSSAKSLTAVRQLAQMSLSPTGDNPDKFIETSFKDRQILADAIAARAFFIITEDVDDFAEKDLNLAGISAVNHDLFLSERMTESGYIDALTLLSERMRNPPWTPAQLHSQLGKVHPLTVAKHHAVFTTTPMPATDNLPTHLYRGRRCLRCCQIKNSFHRGVCDACQAQNQDHS